MPSYRAGGAERVMVTLANGFAACGWNVDLVVCQAEGPLRFDLDSRVMEVDLRQSRVAFGLPKLASYLRRAQPRALLSTIAHANVIAATASRWARWRGRLVLRESTNLGSLDPHYTGWRQKLVLRCVSLGYGRADVIVTGSKGMADDLLARGLPRGRVSVIPNPVDLSIVAKTEQMLTGHPWLDNASTPVILAAGRLIRDKGYDLLLEAFAHLRKQREARLLILGEGEERGALERQLHSLGIRNDVHMPGFVDPIFPWLARCTVFVLTSRREGLPNALIQALACGCNIVAADCASGPAEILESGKWGRLVAPESVPALVQGLAQALDSPVTTREAARERARFYSVDRILSEYRAVLGLEPPICERF
jgi:glycosyltransferase involved in cell wall biosynthesis